MSNPTEAPASRRKAHDRSIALVWAGIAFLMPPIAGISLIDDTLLGIPFPLLYVFIVWAGLIAGAAALARPLRDSDKNTSGPPGPPDPAD